MKDTNYFLGVDVGTGSVRAGIFDQQGRMAASATHPIELWYPQPDFVEQSSENIWQACLKSIREALDSAGLEPGAIKGIGFDATCSLVVLDGDDRPLPVSPDGAAEQNIIVWMDHRAKGEADEITRGGHSVLKYVGGVMSAEMQTPKLLWLKRNHPETWSKAGRFFDLSDYLVYRATGADVRSACTTTCKWTYLSHEDSWDDSYFSVIGLEDLAGNGYEKIGRRVRPVGESVGEGLTGGAAEELGLQPGTAVAVGIIDAHAGGLGLLGMNAENENLEDRIALIGGTSSCHMAASQEPKFINGVWGPYYSAMIPGLWLTEGGQSATGALIDHVIFSSKQSVELEELAGKQKKTVYELLNERLAEMAGKKSTRAKSATDKSTAAEKETFDVGMLTEDLHVLPYFHGNRSPRANPFLTGSISGLKLSATLDDLALLYLATIQSVAYGTRHIIETMNENGYAINQIMATGGGTKNEVFLQQHADICGCRTLLPEEPEAVLLGSAVLGAVAAGTYSSIMEAMKGMNRAGRVIEPETTGNAAANKIEIEPGTVYGEKSSELTRYHNAKYRIFKKMYKDSVAYSEIMKQR